MQGRQLILVVLILALQTSISVATPQIRDRLTFGGRNWSIGEKPMLGLWDYTGKPSPEPGKVKPPEFEVRSSTNWFGYEAEFEIRKLKLFLKGISGRIAGKQRKNEEIIPGKRFPVVATWFTGRVHLAIGHFDHKSQESTAVIVFHVKKGVITKTGFAERMKPVWTWNGLPAKPTRDVENDTERQ